MGCGQRGEEVGCLASLPKLRQRDRRKAAAMEKSLRAAARIVEQAMYAEAFRTVGLLA